MLNAFVILIFETVLTTVHRQQNDNAFIQLLQRARLGSITDDDLLALRQRIWKVASSSSNSDLNIKRTFLSTHVNQAKIKNKNELKKLKGLHVTYKSQDFIGKYFKRRSGTRMEHCSHYIDFY